MEQYQTLISVILEKLQQTHKELKFNYNGLDSVLKEHSTDKVNDTPELITITELRDIYTELIQCLEDRMPGIK